jgi:periplasmic copper chaperone A
MHSKKRGLLRSCLITTAALLACVLATPSHGAEQVKAGDLVISQPWARATPGGAKVGGAYVTIENDGSAPDRLISASSDVAGKVEVHEMATVNGVMKMRPVEQGLTIEPGKKVSLAPGGYHLMLMDLKKPLKDGDQLPVTLNFERAGPVKLSVGVEGVGAKGPKGADSMGGRMHMEMKDPSGGKM